ncbi:prepilin-type N-terminal cleavage/methylation domain-containing protein [Flavimobilis soli]|uniref:Prepilin-type N-terminal cleavage/methylation domain-containing protein n=1 Tax=Flavimobilis soli TaxID=442709 RepID=A0A2A9E9B2_9MICO|nr:prepilin-type N-terminal cleavage/methylation domain-containing protein [Flavimobilis soli]
MIARVQKSMQEKDKGFTLIELLVVIIIIGILSAIAIPVFLNQRKKAIDAGIKSDIRTIANEMETFYVDNQTYVGAVTVNGDTVTLNGVTGTGNTVTLSDEDTVITVAPTAEDFVITGQNTTKGTGTTFTYNSAAGGLQ